MRPSTSRPAGERDPGAYVVRSTEPANGGGVVYTVVDMAGRVSRVTLPRHLTLSELADPVIRHHVAMIAARCDR